MEDHEEGDADKSTHTIDTEEDEQEEEHAEIDLNKAKARLSVPRAAVSAEAYGQFNKKEDFTPIVVPKSDDQKHRIKVRILQSFLFQNLEPKDLGIVIDAMEEKTFK